MSLISDALKTAQRERAGRNSSTTSGQALIEGFFPFVSTSAPSDSSRRKRIALISGASVVVLAVAVYLFIPALRRGRTPPRQVVLPPPAQPVRTVAADPPTAAAPSAAQAAVADSSVPVEVVIDPAPKSTAKSPGVANADPVVRSAPRNVKATDAEDTRTIVPVTQASAGPANPIPVRRDYEAQAAALFNAGDWEGARGQFELAVKYSPNARAWTNYGVTLQRLRDLPAARAAYQAAIGLDATYLEAWLFNARVAMELGEPQVAVPLLLRARSINPRHAGVNVDLAQLESEAKNWTESRRFAEEALRTEPGNARAHWYLAIAADQLKDVDVAVREYTAYLQLSGGTENARTTGYARERLELMRKRP